jgi:hypothetical protein
MGGACGTFGREVRCVQFFFLGGGPEGKRPLGRLKPRWEGDIKMDLQEVGWSIDWIDLAQDRDRWRAFVNEVMNLRVL